MMDIDESYGIWPHDEDDDLTWPLDADSDEDGDRDAHIRGKTLPFLRFSPGQNETVPVPIGSPKK